MDWREEVAAARRLRSDLDAESRRADRLAGFARQARRQVGAAGAPLLADRTERLREEWVQDRLVEAGRARARSLGWPDAYAYTKALGERALLQRRGDVPLTIVRPSIIESALAEPRPGWIRGFRMAEPVIISYARGLLKEFPGLPEGVVDVIPVDLVVAALLAVAARGPDPVGADGRPVGVGCAQPAALPPARRPRARVLHRASALRHRRPADRGAGVDVPRPRPGAAPAAAGQHRPRPGRARWSPPCPSGASRPRSAAASRSSEPRPTGRSSYVELYGAYAECEAIYGVDRLLELAGVDRRSRPAAAGSSTPP